MLESICYALVLLAPISLAVTLIAHLTVFIVLSPDRRRRGGPTPPITILKPLKGAEDGLHENLASLAQQDYPEYEVLVGAEDALTGTDQARAVAAAVPGARLEIIEGSGHSPQVERPADFVRLVLPFLER
jgi:pimeloyl-ACP methyl ester carboxylesterase